MKTFKNKTTEIDKTHNKKDGQMTFADIAVSCVNFIPQGGLNPEEMRDRINVLEKIKKSNGSIKLEDAEHNTLKSCVNNMKWVIVHKDIVEFTDAVNNAK